MNLLQVRTKLVELSGLYSLVNDAHNDDYSDNGADFFIQEGQKWLDRQLDTPQASAEFKATLTKGDYTIAVSDARAVKRVRVEGIGYLEKSSMPQIWDRYGSDQKISNADQGEPREYALGIHRDQGDTTKTKLTDKLLYVLPPADKSYTVFVEGLYFSALLEQDADENHWSLANPGILIQAALYFRETFMRNSQGMNDWRNAILDSIQGIDFDQVEEESAEIDQMKDSWNFRNHQPTINRGTARR